MGFWETILAITIGGAFAGIIITIFTILFSYWWERRGKIKVTFLNWRNHFHKKDGKLIQFNPESTNINKIQKYSFDFVSNIINKKKETTKIIDPRISFGRDSIRIDKGLFLSQQHPYDNKKPLTRVITLPPNEWVILSGHGEIDRDYTDLNFNAVIKSKLIKLIGSLPNKKTFQKTIRIEGRLVTPSSRQRKLEDN